MDPELKSCVARLVPKPTADDQRAKARADLADELDALAKKVRDPQFPIRELAIAYTTTGSSESTLNFDHYRYNLTQWEYLALLRIWEEKVLDGIKV